MLSFLLPVALPALAFPRLASAAFSSTGQTLEVDGIYYYAPAKAVSSLDVQTTHVYISARAATLSPITVISANSSTFTTADVLATVDGFAPTDDVFSPGFADTIYVQGLEGDSVEFSRDSSNITILAANSTEAVPSGPYFLAPSGELYSAWRLYTDFAGAFTETIVPSSSDAFSVLPANIPGQSKAIAVPSRLYYTRTAEKPLAGVRIGMKDIFDMKGLRTSNGNRAWYHLYPPAEENALVVQRLVDAGAIIVGKMHTSQFANGESPTADWVDYHAPFNPRGDGYQIASSSSTGPGAGAASFHWLDATLGSDTGGSIRGPSQVGGLYGNRPTHNLVELTGAMPLSPDLDTAGFLLRDPLLWVEVAKALYLDNVTVSHEYPTDLKVYGLEELSEEPGHDIVSNFITNVTDFLGANVTVYDYLEDWSSSRPPGSFENITEALNTTYPTLVTKQQTGLVRDPFFADYAAAHDGRRPFVNPVASTRWAWGDEQPANAEAEATANRTLFAEWVDSHVLVPDEHTCSESLLCYRTPPAENYRDEYRDPPTIPFGFDIDTFSPFWGGPDFVLPLGQVPYFSNVTLHEEFLPVTVNVMAARGCDGMLFGLVQDLVEAGLLKATLAGQSAVDGGQVLFKRTIHQ